jgi:hypothetical protein
MRLEAGIVFAPRLPFWREKREPRGTAPGGVLLAVAVLKVARSLAHTKKAAAASAKARAKKAAKKGTK